MSTLYSLVLLIALGAGIWQGRKDAVAYIFEQNKGLSYWRLLGSILGFNVLIQLGAAFLALGMSVIVSSQAAFAAATVMIFAGITASVFGGWFISWTFTYMFSMLRSR